MGVIYKLTKDVVDFILAQKKMTPHLGCRDLAKIVSQEFSFPVSKSSVNAVLSDNRLSSPVGRRGISGKKKEKRKFEIPPERRPQLSPSLIPGYREEKHEEMRRVFENAGSIFLWAVLREISETSIFGKISGEIKPPLTAEDAFSVFDAMMISHAMDIKPEAMMGGEGQFFPELLLINKVKNPVSVYQHMINQMLNEEALLRLGIELPSLMKKIQTIKILLGNGSEIFIDPQLTLMLDNNVQSGHSVFFEFALNTITNQLINNVQSIVFLTLPTIRQLGLEDFTDSFYSFLCSFQNLPGKEITKIILQDSLGQEFISFDTIPKKNRYFVAGLWPWQVKFSELKSQIDGETIKKRLSIGFLNREFYVTGGDFNFSNGKPTLPPIEGRIFFLSTGGFQDPELAVITNASEHVLSWDKAIQEYLRSWPNLDQGPRLNEIKVFSEKTEKRLILKNMGSDIDVSNSLSTCCDVKDFVSFFSEILLYFCFERFFPSLVSTGAFENIENKAVKGSFNDHLISGRSSVNNKSIESVQLGISPNISVDKEGLLSILRLPAEMVVEKDHIKIRFILPSGKPFLYRPALEQAILLFNEARKQNKPGLSLFAAIS